MISNLVSRALKRSSSIINARLLSAHRLFSETSAVDIRKVEETSGKATDITLEVGCKAGEPSNSRQDYSALLDKYDFGSFNVYPTMDIFHQLEEQRFKLIESERYRNMLEAIESERYRNMLEAMDEEFKEERDNRFMDEWWNETYLSFDNFSQEIDFLDVNDLRLQEQLDELLWSKMRDQIEWDVAWENLQSEMYRNTFDAMVEEFKEERDKVLMAEWWNETCMAFENFSEYVDIYGVKLQEQRDDLLWSDRRNQMKWDTASKNLNMLELGECYNNVASHVDFSTTQVDAYGNVYTLNVQYRGPVLDERDITNPGSSPAPYSLVLNNIDSDLPPNVYHDEYCCELEQFRAKAIRDLIEFVLVKLKYSLLDPTSYGGRHVKNAGARLMLCHDYIDLVKQLIFEVLLLVPEPPKRSSISNLQFHNDFLKRIHQVLDALMAESPDYVQALWLLQVCYCHPFLDSCIQRAKYHKLMVDAMISLFSLDKYRIYFDKAAHTYSPERYNNLDYNLYNTMELFVKRRIRRYIERRMVAYKRGNISRFLVCQAIRAHMQHSNFNVLFTDSHYKGISGYTSYQLADQVFPFLGCSVLDLFHVATLDTENPYMFDIRGILPLI